LASTYTNIFAGLVSPGAPKVRQPAWERRKPRSFAAPFKPYAPLQYRQNSNASGRSGAIRPLGLAMKLPMRCHCAALSEI
jgi:hypothetical protein